MTLVLALLCAGLSAAADDFVVDPGAACLKKGDEDGVVYCTIQAAIDAAHLEGGGDVTVAPGIYHENLILREDVKVKAEDGGVIIEYVNDRAVPPVLVRAADNAGLHGVTLRAAPGTEVPVTLLHIMAVEDVEIEEVAFDGGFNRGSVGIFVENQMLETSVVKKSTFQKLEVGILAEDTRFRITRCLFEDILRDAIFVRPPSAKGGIEVEGEDGDLDDPEIGDDDDLEFTGFNRFRNIGGFTDTLGAPINPGDAFLLRNTTGRLLTAQLNDWGLYEPEAIASGLSTAAPGAKAAALGGADAAVFEPFIGKSVFPGSIFARFKDEMSVLTNVNASLLLGAAPTGIAPDFDPRSRLYAFTFLSPAIYTVRGEAPAHLSNTRTTSVLAGDIIAIDILLPSDGTAEGEPPEARHSLDTNNNKRVDLPELLRVIQFFNTTSLHCDNTTEDGYAIGPGDLTCPPHAADYNPADWRISLSELLRSIQFYNLGGYHYCPEAATEDGYCPGP